MDYRRCKTGAGRRKMAERNTAEELDDVYEIKYSTDAMTGGADKIRII